MRIIFVLLFFLSYIQADHDPKDFITRFITALRSKDHTASRKFLSNDFEMLNCDETRSMNREQFLTGATFEKLGIAEEIDWTVSNETAGEIIANFNGYMEIKYVTKIVNSELVIIWERHFNCNEARIGMHVALRQFDKYKEAIRTKNREMAKEVMHPRMRFSSCHPEKNHIDFTDFFDYLERLHIPTLPLHNGHFIWAKSGEIVGGEDGTEILGAAMRLDNSMLLTFMLIWSKETESYMFFGESPKDCPYQYYISGLIDEQQLGEMISKALLQKYILAHKYKSAKRFSQILSTRCEIKTKCEGEANQIKNPLNILSYSLFRPDQRAEVWHFVTNFFQHNNNNITLKARLNKNAVVEMTLKEWGEGYKIVALTFLECRKSLQASKYIDEKQRLFEANTVRFAENRISRFINAIRDNNTAQLFKNIVLNPFTIITGQKSAKLYTRETFKIHELYPGPMPDLEVIKAEWLTKNDLKFTVLGGDKIKYEYEVTSYFGKYLITSENRTLTM